MQITITARHFSATEKLKTYSEKEVSALKKLNPSIQDCKIVYEYDAHQNKTAEVHVHVPGDVFHAKETSEDFYKSLDLTIHKLERQILKHKDKQKKKH